MEDCKVVQAVFGNGRTDGRIGQLHVVGGRLKGVSSAYDASEAIDETEQARLVGTFEKLRTKLLDLTLRNPMLSYKPHSRSRKHLRLIDDAPEDVHERLSVEELELDLVPLPDLPDIPHDERTEEFKSHLAYLKSTDAKYLTALKELEANGRDNKSEVSKLDRALCDEVRKCLGLPPRPTRKQIDLADHARQNGVNPSEELQKDGKKTGARRKRLQTLLFSDNLSTRLEAIQDLARLAQQEMGLSTLFIAFGFLEWRQSEDFGQVPFRTAVAASSSSFKPHREG